MDYSLVQKFLRIVRAYSNNSIPPGTYDQEEADSSCQAALLSDQAVPILLESHKQGQFQVDVPMKPDERRILLSHRSQITGQFNGF